MPLFQLIKKDEDGDVEVTIVEAPRQPTQLQAEDYYGIDRDNFDDRDAVTVSKVEIVHIREFRNIVTGFRKEKRGL